MEDDRAANRERVCGDRCSDAICVPSRPRKAETLEQKASRQIGADDPETRKRLRKLGEIENAAT